MSPTTPIEHSTPPLTVEDLAQCALEMVRNEQWSELTSLLSKDPFIAKVPVESQGRLLLHYAGMYCAPHHIMEALIDANPDGPATRAKMGCLPLFPVLRRGPAANLSTVRLILKSRGVKGTLIMRNDLGMCPLHLGAMHGVKESVMEEVLRLEPRAALLERTRDGATPLMMYWYRVLNCKKGKASFENLIRSLRCEDNSVTISDEYRDYFIESWKTMSVLLRSGYKSQMLYLKKVPAAKYLPLHAIASLRCPSSMLALAFYMNSLDKERRVNENFCPTEVDEFGNNALFIAMEYMWTERQILPDAGPCDDENVDENSVSSVDEDDDNSTYANGDEQVSKHRSAELKDRPIEMFADNSGISIFHTLLKKYPNLSHLRHQKGIHPIHAAISRGISWNDGLKTILAASPDAAHAQNASRLYPFMYSASKIWTLLDDAYLLLKTRPNLVSTGINVSRKRRFENSCAEMDAIDLKKTPCLLSDF